MILSITPDRLRDVLTLAPQATILSLDCFDTLLWRQCHRPVDLFHHLAGVSQPQRIWAEGRARSHEWRHHGRSETSIEAIHAQLRPNADAAAIERAVADELALEARHCFAFAPTLALMRAARARGMGVVVVSDTYLSSDQLGDLIRRSAGPEAAEMIDRVFTSRDHGRGKGDGLFGDVLAALGVDAAAMVHVGDNRRADHDAARRHAICGIHLRQFDDATERRLRQEANAERLINGSGQTAAVQPHRAVIAVGEPAITDEAERFGLAALGPVLHGFHQWIEGEAAALERRGGRVHRLYLLRDVHLPAAYAAALAAAQGEAHVPVTVEISRFTATAASFVDAAAVHQFLDREGDADPDWLARQLLIRPGELARDARGHNARQRRAALTRALSGGKALAGVLARSRDLADRLVAHVAAAAAIAPGDTLMLIDLGYNGSVQNAVAPLLAERLGVHVAGRYLLLREQELSGLDKAGMIGPDSHDAAALDALCGTVALIEQLSTRAQGSVIDYAADGTPLRRAQGIKGRQSDVRDRVQRGACGFAAVAQAVAVPASASAWQQAATAALTRLLLLPHPDEMALVEAFDHDVNLGTEDHVPLFDSAVAAQSLRCDGIGSLPTIKRMFVPGELAGQGLELGLGFATIKRFALDLRADDFDARSIDLPVLFHRDDSIIADRLAAPMTHDGFHRALIPVGHGEFAVGVPLGQCWSWVEVAAAELIPIAAIRHGTEGKARPLVPIADGITMVAPGLLCCDPGGLLLFPPSGRSRTAMALRLVFRPIAAAASAAPAMAIAS